MASKCREALGTASKSSRETLRGSAFGMPLSSRASSMSTKIHPTQLRLDHPVQTQRSRTPATQETPRQRQPPRPPSLLHKQHKHPLPTIHNRLLLPAGVMFKISSFDEA